MHASPFCLLAFAREVKRHCIVFSVAGGFRIKLSVSFVFKLERLSSDFVFTFSKILNINYFHTCEVLLLKGRKLRSRECAFRDNNTHSVSGSKRACPFFSSYCGTDGAWPLLLVPLLVLAGIHFYCLFVL